MKKVFYLSTCSTCKRILKELELDDSYNLQDLKKEAISEADLQVLHDLSGSYESLFNRRSTKYKEYELKLKTLTEDDYKKYILEHYSFLKRPTAIIGEKAFVGNSKKTIESLKEYIQD